MFGSILLVINCALKKLNYLEINNKFRGGLLGLKLLLSETAAMNETAASGNDSAADVKVLLKLNAADRIYC